MKKRYKYLVVLSMIIFAWACNPEESTEGSEGRTLTEDDFASNEVVDIYFFHGNKLIGVRDNGRPEAVLEEPFPINEFLNMELPGAAPVSSPSMAHLDDEWVVWQSQNIFTYPKSIMTVTIDRTLYTYNLPSGTLQWQLDLGGTTTSSTIYEHYGNYGTRSTDEDVMITGYVGTLNGQFHAIDMVSGNIKWTFTTESGLGFSGNALLLEAFGQNLIIVGAEDGYVYGLNSNTGVQEWRYNTRAAVQGQPAVIYYQGYTYVATVNISGLVTMHDPDNGTALWSTQLPTTIGASLFSYKLEEQVNASLAIGGINGTVYSLNGRNGQIEWEYDTGSPILSSIKSRYFLNSSLSTNSSFKLSNLYVTTEGGKVLALKVDGTLNWEAQLDHGPLYASPLLTSTLDNDFNSGTALHVQTPLGIVGIEALTGRIYSQYLATNSSVESGNGLSSPFGVKVNRLNFSNSETPPAIEFSKSSIINYKNVN